jgi:hypothetical protein
MTFSPLAIRRRYILGDLAEKCESVERIPVYLDNTDDPPVGYADESLGPYADAFLFDLPEDVCKRLATNGYDLDVDYDVRGVETEGERKERFKLNHIILTSRAPKSAIPRRHPLIKRVD